MLFERDRSRPRRGSHPPSYPSGQPDPGLAARRSRPPLSKRVRPGHWVALDVVVGVLIGMSGALTAGHDFVTLPSRLLLTAVIAVPICLRRRYPLPAFGAMIVTAVIAVTAGVAVPAGPLIFLGMACVLYLVTTRAGRLVGMAALALGLTVIMVTQVLVDTHQIPQRGQSSWFAAVALIIAWMAGHSVRQRRLYAQMLQHEAASSAVAGERLRIARELHDVVAHSMSVIAVQAGYGQYVIDVSPAGAREALGAIQATSREALEEMRRMLGVLRQEDPASGRERPGPESLAPPPGLDDLDQLIQRVRGAGVEVDVERSGRVRVVPASIGLSAYRIIQEALTNIVKHAGVGARSTVSLGFGEAALHVRIADDGGRPLVPTAGVPVVVGTGHGLVGMRERAHLCGGDFVASPLAGGGFEVFVTLPLPGAVREPAEPGAVRESGGTGAVREPGGTGSSNGSGGRTGSLNAPGGRDGGGPA